MKWENLREEEFDTAIEKSGKLCVIPIGCLEKHGQHLPVGTDNFIAKKVVYEAAKQEDVVIFDPGSWLGEVSTFHSYENPGNEKMRGCIGIKQDLILEIFEVLCDEIARNGFEKILFVNSHGGNTLILKHFMRCQSYTKKPYATMWAWGVEDSMTNADVLLKEYENRPEFLSMLTDEDIKVLKDWAEKAPDYGGGHADFRETAMVMVHDESLVAQDKYDAESGLSNHSTDYLDKEGIDIVNGWITSHPTSYSGLAPFGCSKTIGEAMVKINAERVARIFKLLKEDKNAVKIANIIPPEKW
jgi:creatinine amidohydrolase